jgi:hypothetical protein
VIVVFLLVIGSYVGKYTKTCFPVKIETYQQVGKRKEPSMLADQPAEKEQ